MIPSTMPRRRTVIRSVTSVSGGRGRGSGRQDRGQAAMGMDPVTGSVIPGQTRSSIRRAKRPCRR